MLIIIMTIDLLSFFKKKVTRFRFITDKYSIFLALFAPQVQKRRLLLFLAKKIEATSWKVK